MVWEARAYIIHPQSCSSICTAGNRCICPGLSDKYAWRRITPLPLNRISGTMLRRMLTRRSHLRREVLRWVGRNYASDSWTLNSPEIGSEMVRLKLSMSLPSIHFLYVQAASPFQSFFR